MNKENNHERNRIDLIMKYLGSKSLSINDIINSIYRDDIINGVNRNSWRFYVHLNKLFAKMERMDLIKHIGYKDGEYKTEKVWRKKWTTLTMI